MSKLSRLAPKPSREAVDGKGRSRPLRYDDAPEDA